MRVGEIREACEQAIAWLTPLPEDRTDKALTLKHRKGVALEILREVACPDRCKGKRRAA